MISWIEFTQVMYDMIFDNHIHNYETLVLDLT